MAVVDPVPTEKTPEELKAVYDTLSKTHGRVPNFFATMAHRPGALKAFLPLYATVMREGTVEAKYKELAYLKTSHLNGCEYCGRAHSPAARRAGVTQEQIAALTFYERSPLFDEKEKAVLLYTERVTRAAGAGLRDAAMGDLKRLFSEDQVVELALVICMANFTNRFNNGLRIEPDLG
jgi:uncharacterized peroxidase-related enzyme